MTQFACTRDDVQRGSKTPRSTQFLRTPGNTMPARIAPVTGTLHGRGLRACDPSRAGGLLKDEHRNAQRPRPKAIDLSWARAVRSRPITEPRKLRQLRLELRRSPRSRPVCEPFPIYGVCRTWCSFGRLVTGTTPRRVRMIDSSFVFSSTTMRGQDPLLHLWCPVDLEVLACSRNRRVEGAVRNALLVGVGDHDLHAGELQALFAVDRDGVRRLEGSTVVAVSSSSSVLARS